MGVLLGVDTGGTYTDAVLIRDDAQVVASAKALTTRGDLAIGIGGPVNRIRGRHEGFRNMLLREVDAFGRSSELFTDLEGAITGLP